jgi:hypothetical protein
VRISVTKKGREAPLVFGPQGSLGAPRLAFEPEGSAKLLKPAIVRFRPIAPSGSNLLGDAIFMLRHGSALVVR